MNSPEKQLKYSIRKVSVGAASVVIGALYLLMGAGVAHAEDVGSAREAERTANPTSEQSGNGDTGNKPSLDNTDATTTYSAPATENPLVAPEAAKPRKRRALADGETGDAPAGGTANTSTGTETPTGTSAGNNGASDSTVTERKGATVKPDQPGVNVPKGNEHGAHDPSAHLSFNDPDHTATVEEMWKIIQNMPDDFQNNERSYLRNMDTLGDELRFDKNGNVTTDPSGVKLQPGEIREISSFGGWTAIMKKDGETGKFAIGMKNKEGYFTGWYTDKNGKRQEGGMLGSNALDQIYVHEQALDRRFKYMLMLAKGRTIANKDDKAQDGTPFEIKTQNSDANKTTLANLPVKEREDILQHAPNIEGFNGIEKTFKAFSTKYGSRLKIDFVTGYISDFEGSKGTYRIVVKAIKEDKSEETVYDHTINRIDGVVENEERYSQGVDLSAVNSKIKEILRGEFSKKVDNLADEKYKKKYPTRRGRPDQAILTALKEEAKQELVKNGNAIVELPIDKDELREGKRNKFKEELKIEATYTYVANSLNTILSKMNDEEVRSKSPIWKNNGDKYPDNPNLVKSKDPDRVYKLLDFILPTAKKIIYHADTDQLELETDPVKVKSHRQELEARLKTKEASLASSTNEEEKTKLNKEISALKSAIGSTNAYTYTEARNGSKQAKILGSHMEATSKPDTSTLSNSEYEKYRTNELAVNEKDGLANFTGYFVEKNNVTRTNVLADDELSKKITDAIEGDQDKLGKGGYFSTGDIPLGKDVVSYKVQVFAENEKRVAVNNQSPRLQYNLPILADFSVIQDTVEPSKEVARRIISKSNLPEDKKKKIIEEIEKSKKTSELRAAMSKNVKVRYVDKATGNVITNIKNDKAFGEKDSENRYTAAKDVLINSDYNVTDRAYSTLSTTDDKYYRLVADNGGLATDSEPATGTIGTTDKVVTFLYEVAEKPATPTTGKGVVHFKKQVSETVTEPLTGYGDITLEGNVGDTFSSTDVDTKITALKNAGYEIVSDTFTNGDKTIDSVTDTDGQDPSQVYNVTVREKVVDVPPFEPTDPKDPNKPEPGQPIDPENPNGPKWTKALIDKLETTKHVTRTITYVEDGTDTEVANKATDKVTFTRSLKVNVVTGDVVDPNVAWTSNDTTFEAVTSPVVKGYVLKANQGSEDGLVSTDGTRVVASANLTEASENQNVKVLYTKLGSWVPTPPAGVTPPTGTNFDPKPYPNNPTDPTKPKDPEYPQPGTPTDPNKPKPPVIPYVPGYTPKTPNGNPLEPVDPNHPENGYKVPPVPTTPGKDTPIEYSKDSQKAIVKVFNTTTGTEVELPKEKVELSGKTGEEIPTNSVAAKIADLEKRGYTVENKEPLKGETFDKNKDPENGDPTQVFKLLVKERTVTVTEPKNPNEPVDPDKPEGPKWPTEGLAKSDLEKEVTRTITYVKKETADGPEIADAKPTKKQTAHFKRSATYNLVTKVVTPGEWTSTDKVLEAVTTEKLDGYVADKASVEEVETNVNSTDLDKKVVYTKLGSWIPKVPGEETPTPLPYPNNPDDPTKPGTPVYPEPGTPTDPNTPKPPVIPYVPGYTPKTPDGNPLVPVDPEHPENGYKVPPVPTEPGRDTPIEYVKDGQQKAITSFVDPKGNVLETPITETGDSNTPLTKDGEIKATIAKLKLKGYDVETNTYPPKGTFDNDPKVDQYFKVTLTPRVKPVKPFDPTNPKDPNKPVPGQPIDPDTPVDPNNPNDPTIPRWTDELIKKLDVKKEVTRTINYVDEAGNKVSEPSTDKVTFTREAKINVVTGEITYGDWKAVGGDSTFDKVSSPVVKGYILKDPAQKEVAERKGITPTVANQTIEVVYKKLGSWIPKVPGVETPTPLPYPNHPTDPTKPGEPTDPNTPNVPVIPYVPGYTPKIGETPLQPKVPNDPTKGYIPPVPTEPGKDTPIEYVKVPNTPSPEEPVKPTPESNHITIWVYENGKPLKPEKPGTHEPGNIPGYRFITTTTKDGVTIHRFEKISPVEPNNPVPQKPTTPIPTPQDPTIPTPESQIPTPNTPEANTPTSETSRREELPNTGTEANAGLASAGIMTLLAGLGLGFFKKKEEDDK